MNTIFWIVEQPDYHCGDALVFLLLQNSPTTTKHFIMISSSESSFLEWKHLPLNSTTGQPIVSLAYNPHNNLLALLNQVIMFIELVANPFFIELFFCIISSYCEWIRCCRYYSGNCCRIRIWQGYSSIIQTSN